MRIFLTGATGFIGSAIIPELHAAGHQVLGLTRSDAGAQTLLAAGAEVHRGDIEDLESLRTGAAQADAVLHTAFDHNFTTFAANCEKDRRVIEALGSVLTGSQRPLLITSGVAMGTATLGQPATEDFFNPNHPNPRVASEQAAAALADTGVNVAVIRLPQVHDTHKQGLVTYLIDLARARGLSAYVGDGQNRWSAGPLPDVARLYRLALEHQAQNPAPGTRYNAVAEQGVPLKAIAETIGAGLSIPVVSLSPDDAAAHFGWLTHFAAADMSADSTWTQQTLDWHPTGPTLLTDLANMHY